MTRHFLVSIDGGKPVHLTMAEYALACDLARLEGRPAPRLMV
jgi:hypothetical protein